MEENKKRKTEEPPVKKDNFWIKVIILTTVIVWISLAAGSWVGDKVAKEKIVSGQKETEISAAQKPKTWKTIVQVDNGENFKTDENGDLTISDFRNIDDPIPGIDDQSIKTLNAKDIIPVQEPVQTPTPPTLEQAKEEMNKKQETTEPAQEQNNPSDAPVSSSDTPTQNGTETPKPTPTTSASAPAPTPTTTPTPNKTAEPSKEEAKTSPKNYELQMGSFSNQENAQKLAEDLKGKGHQVKIEKVKDGDKEYFKVKTDSVGTQDSAREQADKLKKEGIDAIIISN